jgi:DNA-binding transcriptional MerR regulator
MEDLVPIGRFAAICGLSHRALRLYDESGLLPPAWVDPSSGYRFYTLSQVRTAQLIRLLRGVEVSLETIAELLAEPDPEQVLGRLDAHALSLEERILEWRCVFAYLRRILDPKEEEMTYEVQLKAAEPVPVVSESREVSIDQLVPFIVDSVASLRDRAGEAWKGHEYFVIYHGQVNAETDGRVEVALPVTARVEGSGELAGGLIASTVVRGPQTRFPEILGAYDAVAEWVRRNGHELAGSPREVYVGEAAEEVDRIEIAWPIR